MSIVGPPTKTCCRCRETKPTAEFGRWTRSKDGLTSQCLVCRRLMGAMRRETHRDLLAEQKRQRYRADPAGARRRNDAWKARNPERHRYLVRRSWLKNMYNLTPEQYEELLATHGRRCALCGRSHDTKALHIDHDHGCCPGKKSCGRCIRGLVCSTCNRLLGWFDNNREAILAYTKGK